MKVRKLLATLSAVTVLASSLSSMILLTSAETSTKYETKPSYEAALANGQAIKLITDFADVDGGVHTFSMTSSQKLTDTNWKTGDFTGTDTAEYLQFEVNNQTAVTAQLYNLIIDTNASGYNIMPTVDNPYYLYDYNSKTWSELTLTKSNTHKLACISVPANSNVIVRIPISSFKQSARGVTYVQASTDYVLKNNKVSDIHCYIETPGLTEDGIVTIDNLAWILGTMSPVDGGDPEPPVDGGDPEYKTTDDVKLNPGELYRPLTGFESDDEVKVIPNEADGELSYDFSNNGDQSFVMTYTDGSAYSHKPFNINTNVGDYSNWTDAKYLQFYIKNTGVSYGNPLQIFHIRLETGSGTIWLNREATGIKLYDINTGKWSDLAVVANSDHLAPALGADIKSPTLQIPGGFEGYVRIPLINENFSNGNIEDELGSITSIKTYGLIRSLADATEIYFDDFGLVSYTGDTAPDYVDGKPNSGEEDNPYEGQTTNFTMTGVLKDQTGKPVSGATVTLNGDATSKTNDKGQFIFKDVSTGYIELTAVGADETDYGYVTFEAITAETTAMDGQNITVAHNTEGITVDIGMDDFGLLLSGVTEGVIEGLTADDNSGNNNNGGDNNTPDQDNSVETGVATAATAGVGIMILASTAIILTRKKRVQNK